MDESIEQFVRRQNIDRYRGLMAQAKDEARRRQLLMLLAEEERKQRNAADPLVNLAQVAAVQFVMHRLGHF